jgi:hypothetical protein
VGFFPSWGVRIESRYCLKEEASMKKSRFLPGFVIVLAFCLLGGSAPGQQSGEGVPTQMVVTVEPHKGKQMPQITRQDVMVYEGKDRDAVTEWTPAEGDKAALQVFLLLDDASGINLGSQLGDLKKFVESQAPTTMVGIAYMQNGIAVVEQNLTSDHAAAEKALRLPQGIIGANASPYFSLQDLIKRWPQTNARRSVLMVTDGIDRYYGIGDMLDPYLDAAIDDALKAHVTVSAIYNPDVGHFGHSYWEAYWGQLYLAHVADETGGEGYYIGFNGPAVAFAPYLQDLTERFSHQYLLTFMAKPQKKAGWQRIRLTTEVKNADLVGPKRVWVAGEPK